MNKQFVIRKKDAQRKSFGDTVVEEYFTTETPRLGLAVAEINGFYPANDKWARNKEVDEMYFVIGGSGRITIEGNEPFEVGEGDAVLFPKGVKYRVEGQKLRVVIPTSPSWTKEQHEHERQVSRPVGCVDKVDVEPSHCSTSRGSPYSISK